MNSFARIFVYFLTNPEFRQQLIGLANKMTSLCSISAARKKEVNAHREAGKERNSVDAQREMNNEPKPKIDEIQSVLMRSVSTASEDTCYL